ncbi:hypothetical protein FAZ95_14215 [Trinickia violacea]|uniref:Uncharacterized protein n=1 Tax=Trinickia violacea TaxID=2571746 RepID=A0A4P8ISK6_9BURK|nr:hypothetical protein [Trinickia violacea]QCP50233.1 hypothetical protein FAZ95_14215 [Trinickia violacea]
MPYRTDYADIIYPDEANSPCALRYRIALTKAPKPLVVVHLEHTESSFEGPASSAIVRDHILNRVCEERLKGIPINAIRLVVTDVSGSFEYAIEVDVDDYIRRGNPYKASPITTARAKVTESISINSDDIVAGRTRVQSVHAKPSALSKDVAAALN